MEGMILTILIYLICLIASDSGRYYINHSHLEECEFSNMRGYCREFRKCPRLFGLLARSGGRPSPTLKKVLRSSLCGFHGKEPIVCCAESRNARIVPEICREYRIVIYEIIGNTFLGGKYIKKYNLPLLNLHWNWNEGTFTVVRLSSSSKRPEEGILPTSCGIVSLHYKIFGGSEAALNDFPWMALIGYDTPQGVQYRCGGTLINRRFVLTAAHCLMNLKSLTPKCVRLGEHDLSTKVDCSEEECAPPARDFPITRFIPHPEFRPKDLQNDIALIELAEDVNYSKSIHPVCLPVGALGKRRLDGGTVTISGWGATENGMYSSVLRKARIRVMPHKTCKDVYEGILSITESQICAGGEGNVDSCSGDSGGPLQGSALGLSRKPVYVQYGLVSFGPRICGSSGKPGVYTRISSYIDWILNEIRRKS